MVLCSVPTRLRGHPVSPNQCERFGLASSLKPSRNESLQSRMHVNMCRKLALWFFFSQPAMCDSKALPSGLIQGHGIERKTSS